MERLTKRIADHVYYTKGQYEETIPAECNASDIRTILQRLAAYEDTGLDPEQVVAMAQDKLQDAEIDVGSKVFDLAICKAFENRYGVTLEHVCDLLAAEKAGRCVVLPCKVGDTVYLANKFEKRVCTCICTEIRQVECGWFAIGIDYETGFKFSLFFDLFRKTVFLTREAAEAALEAHHAD